MCKAFHFVFNLCQCIVGLRVLKSEPFAQWVGQFSWSEVRFPTDEAKHLHMDLQEERRSYVFYVPRPLPLLLIL